jgi:hypothetical protein
MRYKGGLTKGKSHAEGGIKMKVASTGQNIEVEGGEVIVNKKNVADKTKLEFEGEQKTTCEILSDLNSRNGNGVTLECDSVEGKKYKHKEGGKLAKEQKRYTVYAINDSGGYTIAPETFSNYNDALEHYEYLSIDDVDESKDKLKQNLKSLIEDIIVYDEEEDEEEIIDSNFLKSEYIKSANVDTDEIIDEIKDRVKEKYNIGYSQYGSQYQDIDVYDEMDEDEIIGCVQVRVADHSQNPRNLSKSSCEEKVSFVIANVDPTANSFLPLGKEYYFKSYQTVDEIWEEIVDIIDERIDDVRDSYAKGGKLPKKENMENNSDYDTYLENKRIDLFAEYGMKIANIKDLENSLGINRENMPQIRSFAFNDFLEDLDEDNIKYEYELVESKKLKPTQSQVNVDKADKLTKEFVDARFLIASNDDYILDGHHRWYYGLKNDGISKVLRIDMPIRELIDYAKAFDKTQYSDIYAETIFKQGGEVSKVELFMEVREKLVPSQQVAFLMEIDDATEIMDMLSNVVKAYEDIPSLYKEEGKGYNAVAYLHYFVGGVDWWVTEYDKSTGEMFGLSNLNNEWNLGYFNVSFFKNNDLSPLQKPELDFYFKYQTINEILENVYPEKVQPPVERYEQLKSANQKMLVNGTKWQKLINDNSFKNPFEKVQAIEKMIDEKGENPDNYTVTEKKFLTEYTGIGGMEKYGAIPRDVGMGKESDYGLMYEFFTPDSLARMMWGLAYKHSGNMQIKDVLEPSMGAGVFVGQAPLNVNVDGYDINKYCYMINKILYTEERFNFYHDSFEKLFIQNNRSVMGDVTPMYDLVIGNPPYGTYQGKYSVLGNAKSEKNYTKAVNFIDYFISRGLDLLRPNGLLIYVIGSLPVFGSLPFLETEMKSSKRKIMSKCDLVDAYRLGTSMFEFTKVDADIIVLRKK